MDDPLSVVVRVPQNCVERRQISIDWAVLLAYRLVDFTFIICTTLSLQLYPQRTKSAYCGTKKFLLALLAHCTRYFQFCGAAVV